MLFVTMLYLSTLLIFLASGGWLFSETTIIKQFYSSSIMPNTAQVGSVAWYYSSDALMQSNNPFPYKSMGYSQAEFNQIFQDRICDVVGIPETMIVEGPFWKPFFYNIDKNLLPNLSSWEWNGATDFGWLFPGGGIRSAQGYFNQTEQRFYVSDGRQYQVVPEPTSFSLLLAGLVLLINSRRLKNAIT
jgi:hypothetical protein